MSENQMSEAEAYRRLRYQLRKAKVEERKDTTRQRRDNEFLVSCGIAPVIFDDRGRIEWTTNT